MSLFPAPSVKLLVVQSRAGLFERRHPLQFPLCPVGVSMNVNLVCDRPQTAREEEAWRQLGSWTLGCVVSLRGNISSPAATMTSVQALREFVNERLTAVAVEIFTVFQQTIVQYEEEIVRQRRLLDVLKPQIKLRRIEFPDNCDYDEEQHFELEIDSSVEQEEPEPQGIEDSLEEPGPLLIKEEPEEPESPGIIQGPEELRVLQIKQELEDPDFPQIQQEPEQSELVQVNLEQEEPETLQIRKQGEPARLQVEVKQEEPEVQHVKELFDSVLSQNTQLDKCIVVNGEKIPTSTLKPVGVMNRPVLYLLDRVPPPRINTVKPPRRRHEATLDGDEPRIKKPPNAFMLFLKEQRPIVSTELGVKDSAIVNAEMGKRWKSMSHAEQEKYFQQAGVAARLHAQQHPGWTNSNNYGKLKARRKHANKSQESVIKPAAATQSTLVNVPQISRVPQVSQVPRVPQISRAHQVPRVPQVSRAPQASRVPQVPQVSRIPHITHLNNLYPVPEAKNFFPINFAPAMSPAFLSALTSSNSVPLLCNMQQIDPPAADEPPQPSPYQNKSK